jgi:gluconate 2-dehydrogenase gamma chain
MFCDPMHGGNAEMIGWQLVGFPGPRMSYYEDMERHYGEAFRPVPVNLQQVLGHTVPLIEDEDRK